MQREFKDTTVYSKTLNEIWLTLTPNQQQITKPLAGIYPVFNSKEGYNRILSIIDGAKEIICLSSFIIADKKLEQKLVHAAERGVRVYLLTASGTQIRKLEKGDDRLSDRDKKTTDHHADMLDSFLDKILCRSADHLHAKFIIADPIIDQKFNPDSVAIVSTANFAEKGLQISPELLVEVSTKTMGNLANDTLKGIYNLFNQGFWNEAVEELQKKGNWTIIKPESSEYLIEIPSTYKTSNTLREKIISMLGSSEGKIWVSAYSFDIDHSSAKAIINSKIEDITIFTRRKDTNLSFIKRIGQKAKVLCHENLHAKFILREYNNEFEGIIFTSNFTTLGLDSGYEIGIKLNSIQCEALKSIILEWENKMQWEYLNKIEPNNLNNFLNREIGIMDKNRYKQLKVTENIKLATNVIADNFDEYLNYNPVFSHPEIDGDGTIPLKVEHTLILKPPVLPKNAKLITRKEDIRSQKLVNSVEELFNKKDEPKYDLYTDQNKIFLKIKSIKEYSKIKEKIPLSVKIVF